MCYVLCVSSGFVCLKKKKHDSKFEFYDTQQTKQKKGHSNTHTLSFFIQMYTTTIHKITNNKQHTRIIKLINHTRKPSQYTFINKSYTFPKKCFRYTTSRRWNNYGPTVRRFQLTYNSCNVKSKIIHNSRV